MLPEKRGQGPSSQESNLCVHGFGTSPYRYDYSDVCRGAQALRDDFLATREDMRAKSMVNALYGIASLDDSTLHLRPTFQVIQACMDYLVADRGALTILHFSYLMYALGK